MDELKNDNPFKVPEDYFDTLEERLFSKLSQENSDISLAEHSDFIEKGASLPGKEGFAVPDGYFDGLKKNLFEKLEIDETKVISMRSDKVYWYAAVSIAAALLVFLAVYFDRPEKITFESLASSDIEHYFENDDSDFGTYDIAEILPVDKLEIGDITSDKIDEEEVLKYLDNNTDSAEELNFEYDE